MISRAIPDDEIGRVFSVLALFSAASGSLVEAGFQKIYNVREAVKGEKSVGLYTHIYSGICFLDCFLQSGDLSWQLPPGGGWASDHHHPSQYCAQKTLKHTSQLNKHSLTLRLVRGSDISQYFLISSARSIIRSLQRAFLILLGFNRLNF